MKLLTLIFTLFTLNAFAHCPIEFKSEQLCAEINWVDGPFLGETSHLEVMFWEKGDVTHTPVSPKADVDIYSWMIMDNGHSHGGPKFEISEIEAGIFESFDVRFFMGRMKGYWELRIDLNSNRTLVERSSNRVVFK